MTDIFNTDQGKRLLLHRRGRTLAESSVGGHGVVGEENRAVIFP